jgi:hypothetical protein
MIGWKGGRSLNPSSFSWYLTGRSQEREERASHDDAVNTSLPLQSSYKDPVKSLGNFVQPRGFWTTGGLTKPETFQNIYVSCVFDKYMWHVARIPFFLSFFALSTVSYILYSTYNREGTMILTFLRKLEPWPVRIKFLRYISMKLFVFWALHCDFVQNLLKVLL